MQNNTTNEQFGPQGELQAEYEAPAVVDLGGALEFFLGDDGPILDSFKSLTASLGRMCW